MFPMPHPRTRSFVTRSTNRSQKSGLAGRSRTKSNFVVWATQSEKNFKIYLDLLHGANPKPYDMEGDPLGELVWRRIAETIAGEQPFKIADPKKHDAASVAKVVQEIIDQFQFLIEVLGSPKSFTTREIQGRRSPRSGSSSPLPTRTARPTTSTSLPRQIPATARWISKCHPGSQPVCWSRSSSPPTPTL